MTGDMNDDKPFVCPVANCGMRFINEDHLNVHSKKHEMSLALNAGGLSTSSLAHHFLDQTPTPTKFLKSCDEISLFQELTQNPFDHAYKRALDNELPLPGPQMGELNTPTLILSDSLKSSVNAAVGATFHAGGDRSRANEPIKPSPLVKNSLAGKVVLDLSGKSVMTSQPLLSTVAATTAAAAAAAAKRNVTTQGLDHVVLASTVGGTAPQVTRTIGMSKLAKQTVIPQPSGSSIARVQQHHLSACSTGVDGGALSIGAIKQEKVAAGEDAANSSNGSLSEQQQQCTMQVLLQLPSGETVPISIPATINKFHYLGSTRLQQEQKQQQQVVIQQHQHQPPPLQPVPSKTVVSNNSTTQAVKQRLKAQLQNQLSPTAKAADTSMAMTSSVFVTTSTSAAGGMSSQVFTGSTSPVMMIDSPGSEMNLSDSDFSVDGKSQKMSPETGDPEERRQKFLERNRAAAARCRQKRKHWISNLEKKADELQSTNARLQSEVKLLRGEVAQLKTLLLAHKDCPVTQQQRSQGLLQHIILTEPGITAQELAQVVPTADVTSDTLTLGQTIVTFIREPAMPQQDALHGSNE